MSDPQSHHEFNQKEIPLDMLQFTPRGNFPRLRTPGLNEPFNLILPEVLAKAWKL